MTREYNKNIIDEYLYEKAKLLYKTEINLLSQLKCNNQNR